MITMLASRYFKEGESELVGVNDTHRIMNEVMNAWMDDKMVEDIVNEKGEVMNRNQNWVVGERIVGIKTKKLEFFIRVKSKERFFEMKSRVWEICRDEGLHVSIKNTKLKHVKKIGTLVGVCVPCASKVWCQKDIARSIEEDVDNIEIKIENVCQQDYVGRAVVACVTMGKEEEISTKLINKCNENDIGIKYVSFKWTSAIGITNAIRINYYNKLDLRFEVLKGMTIDDTVECSNGISSAKETSMNVKINNRKLFVGIEPGMGKIQTIGQL